MPAITLPVIILVEKSYVEIYATIGSAELDLEAIDVDDGLYRGFDAEGRLLNIESFGQQVKITLAEETPSHQEELRQLLKKDLIGTDEVIKFDDLPSLIKIEEKSARLLLPETRNLITILKDFIVKILKDFNHRIFMKR